MSRTKRCAALATIPRRSHLLPRVLGSLRPQVDHLCVYLNGFAEAPSCVSEFADDYDIDDQNSGAEWKLSWAAQWEGIYLSCDDDIVYPPDYADVMAAEVDRWSGRALITAHGRSYEGVPRNVYAFAKGSRGIAHQHVATGRWVNHGGTGVMAWDTRVVAIPTTWPISNCVDMQVAIWAQRTRVPMRLIPHGADWLNFLAKVDPEGLFMSAKREGFATRNKLLVDYGMEHGWRVLSLG